MHHKFCSLTLTLLLISAVVCFPLEAQDNPKEDDWEILFNGEDLTGWHLLNGRHKVEVEDGVIVGTCIAGLPNGFLATKEQYGDFILELEVKADLLMHNSGIQFRSLSTDEYRDGRVHGYQAEVDITPQKWSGGIYDEARKGWLYILEDPDSPAKEAFKNNQWNTYRIEAIGHTNRIWVNGVPTAHLVDDETTKGFIALQLHGNSRPTVPHGDYQVRFRNIRIKTDHIEPSPFDDIPVVNLIPNHVSEQEKHQGFSLLWDGESISGWKELNGPEKNWEIKNGVLTISSSDDTTSGNNVLMTEDNYDAFELKFDFKQHKEHAVIGIEYRGNGTDSKNTYGWLASKKSKDVGEWNQGVIKVQPDGKVEYWLNGYLILEYYRNIDPPETSGIVLNDPGSPISYRSIKIRKLNE
ncbi:MAG: DUF1080 domain-containing protein [Balneolaceae bacterium]|nr:DUF1080 domain-containing protein [Balneolaceae bacterium]